LNTVSALVKAENISIEDIQHFDYQEAYYFFDGQERSRINIYYNSKQVISNIFSQNQDELSNKLLSLLSSLNHKKIITRPAASSSSDIKNFNFSEPFLEDFYKTLKTLLEPKGITISEISSRSWAEKYFFTRQDNVAVIDFYYNSKKQFTRFAQQPNQGNSIDFMNELYQILSNIVK